MWSNNSINWFLSWDSYQRLVQSNHALWFEVFFFVKVSDLAASSNMMSWIKSHIFTQFPYSFEGEWGCLETNPFCLDSQQCIHRCSLLWGTLHLFLSSESPLVQDTTTIISREFLQIWGWWVYTILVTHGGISL